MTLIITDLNYFSVSKVNRRSRQLLVCVMAAQTMAWSHHEPEVMGSIPASSSLFNKNSLLLIIKCQCISEEYYKMMSK